MQNQSRKSWGAIGARTELCNENSEKKAGVPKSVSFIVHSCAASSVARPCAKLLLGSQIVKGCSSQQG